MTMLDTDALRAAVLAWDQANKHYDDGAMAAAAMRLAELGITDALVEEYRLAHDDGLEAHREELSEESRAAHRANAQVLTDLRRARRIVRDTPMEG